MGAQPFPCPSPLAAGRQDRCGQFSFPPRCHRPDLCSMRNTAADEPTPIIARAGDRRQAPRRAEEARLHYARDLVVERARLVAEAWREYGANHGQLDELAAAVTALGEAEGAAKAAGVLS